MSASVVQMILLLTTLLLLSAFFSAAETAITSSGRGKILALSERHPYRKRFFDWLLRDVQRALTIVLISNNLVNIAASALAASLSIRLMGHIGVLVVVPLMTALIVIFGEVFPKSVAIINQDTVLVMSLPFLRLLDILLAPFLWLLLATVKLLGVLFKVEVKARHPFVTREEFEQMVIIGQESGALEEVERRMIHGVISFEETRVYEIMVPRTDMDAVPADYTLEEAIKIFLEHGHSRIPVFRENLDDIVGILYVKDTIPYLLEGKTASPVSSIMREALFVPESMRVVELFNNMKKKHIHMGVAVDEYGGVAGIATLEDLLEEIVGEIQDEYDKDNPAFTEREDGSYIVQGTMGLEDLSELLDAHFDSEDAESLAGLALSISGDFPSPGERLTYTPDDGAGEWEIEIVEVEDHRIKLLRLIPRENDEEMTPEDTE
ncbi:MAG: hemolysin family protein [Synergistota bacterium]|nr:hemolysin family protein [Synergistota bacterium]